MKSIPLMLRVYGERTEGQWTLICLENSLAAQADTLEAAQASLEAQIKEYLVDAFVGQDKEHAAYLLMGRRAPAKYFLKWYWGRLKQKLAGHFVQRSRAVRQAIPMVPA